MTDFIDANVIVKAFTDNGDKEKCRNCLNEEFVTNALCLVEAQHAISRVSGDKLYAANCVKSIFKSRGLVFELDKNLLFEALKRIEKNNLNIFDLIHYATALTAECARIISYDRDFDGLEIKRIEP